MIIPYRGDLLYDFTKEMLEKSPKLAQQFAELNSRKMIGYWSVSKKYQKLLSESKRKELTKSLKLDLPNAEDYIDNSWNVVERDSVVEYLNSGKRVAMWMGSSDCRICGCCNGNTDLSDGNYIWPMGFSHYVKVHNVKPPEEFLEHVKNKQGSLV